jgi:hypothetical protein
MAEMVDREALAAQVEAEIRPLLDSGVSEYDGGYNCCGCSTYDLILDHALALIRGQRYEDPRPGWAAAARER